MLNTVHAPNKPITATNLIAGSGCGERVSQSVVQTVGSALPSHPGSPSSDNRGPLPHERLGPQEGVYASLLTRFY